jgi:hypothetical protein
MRIAVEMDRRNSPAPWFDLLSRRPADESESPRCQEGTMPYAARSGLAVLLLVLGVGGASAEPAAGSTWTDPPARRPAAEKPSAAEPKAAAPVAATPAAVPQGRPAPAARKAVAARRTPERAARGAPPTKRVASAPRRVRVAAHARAVHAPQVEAVAPPPPPPGYARYRAYGYGPGYGYAPGPADERLDRLSSAEAAGYLVVRRRTVQFPDGRTLRVYRPDDGEPF